MLKVGIVGSGFMGLTHGNAYQQIADVSIAGFVGKGEANRRKRAEEFGANEYPSLEAMLDAEDLDIVDICTPTHLNVEMVRRAAEAGKAILLEKPVARTLAEAEEIRGIVDQAGVPTMVAHVLRFWPEYVKIKELMDSGAIGRPRLASAARICQPPDWTAWYPDPAQSGGVAVTLMIHDFDFCNWLFGVPQEVTAAGHRNEFGAPEDMHVLVRYPDDVAVSFRGSMSMPGGYPFTMALRATGAAGALEFIFRAGVNLENPGEAQSEFMLYRDGKASAPEIEPGDGYLGEIEHFVGCLRDGRPIEIGTVAEATVALRVALAANRSAETGTPVAP